MVHRWKQEPAELAQHIGATEALPHAPPSNHFNEPGPINELAGK